MDLASVLTKTPKGVEEIDTRKYKLEPRLRSILIMVNGKLTGGELAQKLAQLGDVPAMLEQLLLQGFVQGAGDSAGRLKEAKAQLARAIYDLLGPMGDGIAMSIEKAATLEELRAYVESRRETLDLAANKSRVAAFWTKAGGLLG